MPTEEKRYVFDANVVVSALLLPDSVPRRAFDLARTRGVIMLCAETIQELDAVLRRPRLERYVREEERMHFLVRLIREASVMSVTESVQACRDPDDDRYLALAVSCGAACIVSGDQDLLDLHPFRGIPVLSPRQFLDLAP